ncbi:MAG: hypothetical protein V8R40_13295 [Dysosmobacter sp.]
MYRELGGEIITLGSDAHAPGAVGTAMQENQALLRRCGFTRFCTFAAVSPSGMNCEFTILLHRRG